MRLRRAVFLDRDGTLNRVVFNQDGEEDSPSRPEEMSLVPGAGEFTRTVRSAGYLAILATNQPGVAKGTTTIEALRLIHNQLLDLLASHGGGLDYVYYCPHHPSGTAGISSPFVQRCKCRKPAPGMLLRAAAELDLDLSLSWMIGDRLTDVAAGHAAGCRTVLLRRYAHVRSEKDGDGGASPDHIAGTLRDALHFIIPAFMCKNSVP